MQTVRYNNTMYNSLAAYYDALVKDDQATQQWADWIGQVITQGQVLDCACGSGEIDKELTRRGLVVSALDLSQEMIDIAKKKEAANQYYCQNMLDLSNLGQYDGIFCLCDSFNYILSKEDVAHFFQEVFAHLKPGGWFCFDTHSIDRLTEFDQEWNETGTFEDGVNYQWSIMAEDDWIYQDFAFYMEQTIQQEHHMQRVYDPLWLQEQLQPYASQINICTDFDQEGVNEGEKIFFQVRKKEIV